MRMRNWWMQLDTHWRGTEFHFSNMPHARTASALFCLAQWNALPQKLNRKPAKTLESKMTRQQKKQMATSATNETKAKSQSKRMFQIDVSHWIALNLSVGNPAKGRIRNGQKWTSEIIFGNKLSGWDLFGGKARPVPLSRVQNDRLFIFFFYFLAAARFRGADRRCFNPFRARTIAKCQVPRCRNERERTTMAMTTAVTVKGPKYSNRAK